MTRSACGLPVSTVSLAGRLYAAGVLANSTISPLAFTRDGSTTWTLTSGGFAEEHALQPIAGLSTVQPIAATVFRDWMYVFARDAQSAAQRVTSTSDLRSWAPWADVPAAGLPPSSAVAAATLGGTICLFGIYQTGKLPETVLVVENTSSDGGTTWSGWEMVEEGLRPEGGAGWLGVVGPPIILQRAGPRSWARRILLLAALGGQGCDGVVAAKLGRTFTWLALASWRSSGSPISAVRTERTAHPGPLGYVSVRQGDWEPVSEIEPLAIAATVSAGPVVW